jgi:histidine phosphotransferase ChpT
METLSTPGPEAADLATLVASRLCHDLVSPLGAIGNGLELLQMVSEPSPELTLVAEAVASAQARLRLFRLAFGAASEGQSVAPGDLTQAFAALEGSGRVTVDCRLAAPLPRLQARRLALAALCAETALARGGTITVLPGEVLAQGPRLRLEAPVWESLRLGQPSDQTSGATVHFALLAAFGPVALDTAEDRVSLRP